MISYATALLIALCLSSLLAWYLNRPIRIMRSAFNAMSEGKLDTRIFHLLGARRDGLADLGRDFDGMAHRLEDMVADRQRMLRDVSHELRSPLTRLQTAIGLAQQNPHNLHETLDRIENESLRLQAMLENMLTLAHVELGAQSLPREEVDLIDLLAGITSDARFEAQACGKNLAFFGEKTFVATVHVELLYRAFENVIRNAVKYTEPGTCVDVHVECDGSHLSVIVADRGPGVNQDALVKIFEPFYRAPIQSTQAQGFGLGLAIARSAIEFHDGTIAAENRSDGGLVIRIAIPRVK
jgi:two-component system OmpR family sensor kinase